MKPAIHSAISLEAKEDGSQLLDVVNHEQLQGRESMPPADQEMKPSSSNNRIGTGDCFEDVNAFSTNHPDASSLPMLNAAARQRIKEVEAAEQVVAGNKKEDGLRA